MSSHPRPFLDVVDPRTTEQREADAARRTPPGVPLTAQSSPSGAAPSQVVVSPSFLPVGSVIEQVLARREPANGRLSSVRVGRGVAFESRTTTSGRQTLVVEAESVSRRAPGGSVQPPGGIDEPVQVDPGLPPPIDGPGGQPDSDTELEAVSPELARRLHRVVGTAPQQPVPTPPSDDAGSGIRLPGLPAREAAEQPVYVPLLHMVGPATPSAAGGTGLTPTSGGGSGTGPTLSSGGGSGTGGSGDVIIKSPGGASSTEVARAQTAAPTERGPIVVAVIDTGITEELRTDGWLREIERRDETTDWLDRFPVATPPAEDGNGCLDLGAGHGTFVAGIIRQVDPLAHVRVYRAMDSEGFGSELAVAAAMVQAARDGAHVINLSLGAESLDGQLPVVFAAALETIDEITAGRDRPVLVAAAGNSGDTVPVWPAASDRVIAVAGLTPDGTGAPWSSRGPWVDVSTIGEGIVSTYVEGTEDGDFVTSPETFPLNAWAIWTGTSFAAPQIAAAISRTCREQNLTPQTAADRLIGQGASMDEPGFGRALEFLPGT